MNELVYRNPTLEERLSEAYRLESEKYEINQLIDELEALVLWHKDKNRKYVQQYIKAKNALAALEQSKSQLALAIAGKVFICFIVGFILGTILGAVMALIARFPELLGRVICGQSTEDILHEIPASAIKTGAYIAFLAAVLPGTAAGGNDVNHWLKERERTERIKAASYEKALEHLRQKGEFQSYLDEAITLADKYVVISEDFYKDDFIQEDCRNLVAISALYKYVRSRQAEDLNGPDGAYRMFYYDSMIGAIITNLEIAIQKLDEIAGIQELLVSAIRSAQEEVLNALNAIDFSVTNMENSAAAQAYFLKKNNTQEKLQTAILLSQEWERRKKQ